MNVRARGGELAVRLVLVTGVNDDWHWRWFDNLKPLSPIERACGEIWSASAARVRESRARLPFRRDPDAHCRSRTGPARVRLATRAAHRKHHLRRVRRWTGACLWCACRTRLDRVYDAELPDPTTGWCRPRRVDARRDEREARLADGTAHVAVGIPRAAPRAGWRHGYLRPRADARREAAPGRHPGDGR